MRTHLPVTQAMAEMIGLRPDISADFSARIGV
jgi:hypothetical protein